MPETSNTQKTFDAALTHHKAGQFFDAERLYRSILTQNPRHHESMHMLGVLAHQMGQNTPAEILIRQAIAIAPNVAGYHGNLGMVLAAQGKRDEAIESYHTSIRFAPQNPAGYNNLASLLIDTGQFDKAIIASQEAIVRNPQFAEAHYNLGAALRAKGDLPGAASAFRAGTAAKPDYADAYNALGDMLAKQGQTDESIAAFHLAIATKPEFPEAFNNLGNALRDVNRLREAAEAYQKALAIRPDDAVVLNNLGTLLEGLPESAEQCVEVYERALAAQPNLATPYYNLGNALRKLGRIDEAVSEYRKSLAVKPEPAAASNLLYTIHFLDKIDPAEIAREHEEWNGQWVHPLASTRQAPTNDRNPDRALRVGYVSPDFRDHPVGRFILPLLSNHNHDLFKVYCYSDVRQQTPLTPLIQSHAEVWRETFSLSDELLADQIRRDGIDILVDLAMHMDGSRLLAFARKPAPVQVSYLAYCSTTGSETIDYRLTDKFIDPPDQGDGPYCEKPVRLKSYWCYSAPSQAPAVAPLPALAAGHVTFGCLNNFSKVSPRTLETWCQLLRELPDSKLVLHTLAGRHHRALFKYFTDQGIDPNRVEPIGFTTGDQYFNLYNRIDIALDPFPYSGGTTTLDALWMGVPVVSQAGRTSISRGGMSILSNLGCPQWVATDPEQYRKIIKDLASDLPALSSIRAGLRDKLSASALMDGPSFARDVEAAFRSMWHEWCAAGNI